MSRYKKPIKIGAQVVSRGRYVAYQLVEVAIPRQLFADILRLIAELRPPPDPSPACTARLSCVRRKAMEELCLDEEEIELPKAEETEVRGFDARPLTHSASRLANDVHLRNSSIVEASHRVDIGLDMPMEQILETQGCRGTEK